MSNAWSVSSVQAHCWKQAATISGEGVVSAEVLASVAVKMEFSCWFHELKLASRACACALSFAREFGVETDGVA